MRRVITGRAARNILAHGRTIYSGAHEYAEASLDQFPHLDAAFYAETTRVVEAQGFRQLGDLQNLTVTRAGGAMQPAMHDETKAPLSGPEQAPDEWCFS